VKPTEKVIDQKDFTPYAWLVLGILLAVRIAHGVNQASLGYIFGFKGDGLKAGNPFFEMRSAFPSLQENYSLLSGPAFSVSYSIAGIFMGLLVDKVNRKTLLAMACIGWSLTSLVSGMTDSFLVLCLMRFITGMCVSATEPAAFSILGDYFPKRLRTTANSVMNTASYIGSGIASLIVLIVASYGWRWAYLGIGSISLAIGALAFLAVKEPERGIQLKLAFQE
jgi:MFS family permease